MTNQTTSKKLPLKVEFSSTGLKAFFMSAKGIYVAIPFLMVCCIFMASCNYEPIIEPRTPIKPYEIEKPLFNFFGSELVGTWVADSVKINGKDLIPFVKFDMRLNADSTTTISYKEENTFYNTIIRDTINGYWTTNPNRSKIYTYHHPVVIESSSSEGGISYSTYYSTDTFNIKGLSFGLDKDMMRLERNYLGYPHQYRLVRQ